MDAASHLTKEVEPKEGDFSICINCGKPYRLAGWKWRPATSADLAELPPESRRELAMLQAARDMAGLGDLRERGGRA
jgi:hypothetical protein